ncbi:MAG: UDP-N-acetylmuramoyl-L-alanyl-D-glutamate--2,6-diaminopimelate ligase [Myxococcales bacterium]|nr:UDP-N-acetylmuramoyl-L-alanyl-D-glutamate--2,6-diaminopimelate ligase [Myxococcales bacterium]
MTTLAPMTLGTLFTAADVLADVADSRALALVVGRIVCDSRMVQTGDVFVAWQGATSNGLHFASDAVRQGACAVVTDQVVAPAVVAEWKVPVLVVRDARAVAGPLASARLGHPSHSLHVIAVTGTNGKTTTTILIAQLLTAAGHRAAAIGTTGVWTAQGVRPSSLTTPEATDLQALFAQLRAEGFTHVAIEVSSHALDQHRCDGVRFACAVWTNLSHDHLDYHGTMERYAAAKARLFVEFGIAREHCFVNADDPFAADVWDKGLAQAFSLGSHPAAEHQIGDLKCDLQGLRAVLRSVGQPDLAFAAPLVGRHNAENLAGALLVARALGVADGPLRQACALLTAPRGRLEPVPNALGALTVVDYAHTPDALQKILTALRPLVAPQGRLLVVFGCGGDRDPAKRAVMGRIAAELADICVITSDNPRSEQLQAIADAIVAGIRTTRALESQTLSAAATPQSNAVFAVQLDRARAIALAVAALRSGDVLCIAGKGHETTQIIAGESRPFDDVAVATRALHGPSIRNESKILSGFTFDAMTTAFVVGGQVVQASAAVTAMLSTDSRNPQVGALYVALSGEHFDGALFIGDALTRGAVGIVCARGKGQSFAAAAAKAGAWIVEVADSLLALGALAAHYRRRFGLPVVAITGSNGKTTTKELTALALAALGDVLATFANHNNRIGVPQTLAALTSHHAAAVVEAGMSVPNEIAKLAQMAQPQVAIITSVAEAHLEGLGTLAAIANEKFDLVRALHADGVAILPHGEPLLTQLAAGLQCRVVWFGLQGGDVCLAGPVRVEGLHSGEAVVHFDADVLGKRVQVAVPGLGVHLAHNALAALAAASVLGVDVAKAAAALAHYRPVGQRMLPSRCGPWLLLEDCYNANPRSTETALDTLSILPRPHVAVLGAMRELGETSPQLHQRVGAYAAAKGIDWLVTVGSEGNDYAIGARAAGMTSDHIIACADTTAAGLALLRSAPKPATILVKGSRGSRMEGVIAVVKAPANAHLAAGGH